MMAIFGVVAPLFGYNVGSGLVLHSPARTPVKEANMHSESIISRFWAKVDTSGGPDACWLWRAGTNGRSSANQYGVLRVYGRRGGKQYAHRMAWEIERGPIPEGAEVCHNCPDGDNPLCVNPAHLFLGTHADNMKDMAKKGKAGGPGLPGVLHPMAKLGEADVREIRYLARQGWLHREIAARYGVSRSAVSNIVRCKAWSRVP